MMVAQGFRRLRQSDAPSGRLKIDQVRIDFDHRISTAGISAVEPSSAESYPTLEGVVLTI